jgi:hypothetical protein
VVNFVTPLIILTIVATISFFVGLYQIYMIHKYSQVGPKTLVASMILDLCMFIEAIIIISKALNTNPNRFCSQTENQLVFYTVAVISLIRVAHLIVILVYLLIVVPLLCCPNSCCMQYLLSKKSASQKTVAKLDSWSWNFKPPKKQKRA